MEQPLLTCWIRLPAGGFPSERKDWSVRGQKSQRWTLRLENSDSWHTLVPEVCQRRGHTGFSFQSSVPRGSIGTSAGESVRHGAGRVALSSSGCCLLSASGGRRGWCPGDVNLKRHPSAPPSLGYQCARGSYFDRKNLTLRVFWFFPAAFLFFMPSQGNLDPTVLLPEAVFVRRQVDHKEESGL